jgi:hypothetical protein
MKYSKFSKVKAIKYHGCDINIPESSEKILKEKYGPDWKTPNTNWIYWKSPAATRQDDYGYFITYSYQGRK